MSALQSSLNTWLIVAASLTLASCASPESAASQPAGATMTGGRQGADTRSGTGASSADADTRAMCAAHGHTAHGHAARHGALMEQHMKSMTPEMRQRHMEMMRQFCQ